MSNKYGLTDVQFQEERLQVTILENAGKWQINKAPLTYLNNIQLDIVYQVGDVIKCNFYANESEVIPCLHTYLINSYMNINLGNEKPIYCVLIIVFVPAPCLQLLL